MKPVVYLVVYLVPLFSYTFIFSYSAPSGQQWKRPQQHRHHHAGVDRPNGFGYFRHIQIQKEDPGHQHLHSRAAWQRTRGHSDGNLHSGPKPAGRQADLAGPCGCTLRLQKQRLPAIARWHQALWWSAPCVLMVRVHDRLESNTSSLAVTSSKLRKRGHNERSRVFFYPCMDGPAHTVRPEIPPRRLYRFLLLLLRERRGGKINWNTFWLEILFCKDAWSFYVNNVHW